MSSVPTTLAECYLRMTDRLCKPGKEIIDGLTPMYAHLVHMSGCLQDEIGRELLLAVFSNFVGTKTEITEELGDAHFYLSSIYSTVASELGVPPNMYETESGAKSGDDTFHSACYRAIVKAGAIWDLIKRPTLLGRFPKTKTGAIMTREQWLRAVLRECDDLRAELDTLGRSYGLSETTVLSANMEKLIGGPIARYADGVYSDEACQQRADKFGHTDDTQH